MIQNYKCITENQQLNYPSKQKPKKKKDEQKQQSRGLDEALVIAQENPQKFLNPFYIYRIIGGIIINENYLLNQKNVELIDKDMFLYLQHYYQFVSGVYDNLSCSVKFNLSSYNKADFTPWQYICQRLISQNNAQFKMLSDLLSQYQQLIELQIQQQAALQQSPEYQQILQQQEKENTPQYVQKLFENNQDTIFIFVAQFGDIKQLYMAKKFLDLVEWDVEEFILMNVSKQSPQIFLFDAYLETLISIMIQTIHKINSKDFQGPIEQKYVLRTRTGKLINAYCQTLCIQQGTYIYVFYKLIKQVPVQEQKVNPLKLKFTDFLKLGSEQAYEQNLNGAKNYIQKYELKVCKYRPKLEQAQNKSIQLDESTKIISQIQNFNQNQNDTALLKKQ